MTAEDYAKVRQSIVDYGDSFWNDCDDHGSSNADWLIAELNEILDQASLVLRVEIKVESPH